MPNVLPTIMESAGIGFSSAHNARHGLREWLAVLVGTCSRSLTAESAARNLKNARAVPSEKWFRNMTSTISRDGAEAACGMMVRRTVRLAKRRGMGRRGSVPAAVGRHLIGRLGRGSMEHLVCPAWKKGTNRSGAYATARVVAEPVNAVPGCARVARGPPGVDFVRKFVRTLRDCKVRARLVLPGRGSYSAGVMNAPSASGNRYLVPAAGNAGTRRAITEHHHGLGNAAV